MAGFAGFGNAFQGASNATGALQSQEDARRQLAAQAMLAKALQAYAAQQGGQGQGAQAMQAPPVPGAAIQPGGVSPLGAGSTPPAGAAPGGAGLVASPGAAPPQMAMGGGQPPGMDLSRLAQASMSQGGSNGAQGALAQMLLKSMQPQANNAARVYIGDQRNQTSAANTDARVGAEDRGQDLRAKSAADSTQARKDIAAANNRFKLPPTQKPINDPGFRKAEQIYQGAVKTYAASPTDDNYQALQAAATAYNGYSMPGASATSAGASPPVNLQPIPVPPEAKAQPDGATATDENGQKWIKKGDMMVPQP